MLFLQGIVGYSLGKKDLNLFKNIVKNSFILSSISGLIISIIFFFTYNLVINLMSDINEIRELSSSYAVWLIILPAISSFCYQFDGIFIGASQTKELRNAMIFSVFSYLLISILFVFPILKESLSSFIVIVICINVIIYKVSAKDFSFFESKTLLLTIPFWIIFFRSLFSDNFAISAEHIQHSLFFLIIPVFFSLIPSKFFDTQKLNLYMMVLKLTCLLIAIIYIISFFYDYSIIQQY